MFIGLDLGTTNVKALLVAANGEVVARGRAGVRLLHTPDGGVEQDIEEIWQATLAALGALSRRRDGAAVKAIGVSAQGAAVQIVDRTWTPIGRVISWLDGRGRPYDRALTEEMGRDWFVRHTGHGRSGMGLGQVLRLREEDPALLGPGRAVGFVGDAIVKRLCGRPAHDATSLSIAWFYSPRLRGPSPELLRRLGLREDQLPPLLGPRERAGGLLKEAADAVGLPCGIPVGAAVHDQYAASLGSGAVRVGDVMFGAGTAWVLLAVTPRLDPPVIETAFVCTHVVDGLYGQMLSLVNGGSSFGWTLDVLGWREKPHREIDALMASVPVGSGGLRIRPLLAEGGGAGLPLGTTGEWRGIRLGHDPAHILRATVEGLACELARHLRFLTDNAIPVQRLIMTGGATKSRVTPQILCDVAGRSVVTAAESEISALGAAMLARGLVEQDASLEAISSEMAPALRSFAPGADAPAYAGILEEYLGSLPGFPSSTRRK